MAAKKKGIQRKIAIFILIVGMFPVIIGISLVYLQGRKELTKSVGENFANVAKDLASELEGVIEDSVYNVGSIAFAPILINAVASANRFYINRDNPAIERHIKKLDTEWLKSKDRSFYLKYTDSAAAKYLAEIKRHTKGYVELFVTDTKGAVVASAETTKYLYFGKEEWWQAAYNNGKGAVYISKIYYDPDLNQSLQSFAAPIMDKVGKNVIGIVHAVSTTEEIARRLSKFKFGETGHTMLINSEGSVLICPLFPPHMHRVTAQLMNHIATPSKGWGVVKDNAHEGGIDAVAGFAPVAVASGFGLDKLKWYVFVSQSPEESYLFIYTLLKTMTFLFVLSVGILSAMGFWAAKRIVEPIRVLQRGAEIIGQGNLTHRISIKTNDEIEDLANKFNQMVDRINNSYSELEQRIAERTAGLKKRYEEMEELNRLESEFLAGVSHELRTPLNSIMGFSELIIDKAYGDLNEQQMKYINNIHKSGKHLLELINDILDISQIKAGEMDVKPSEFLVSDAIEGARLIVNPLIIKKKISIEIDIDSSVSTIVADERMFKQIMYNLMSNAVKFTNEGGQVKVKAVSNNYFLQVSVSDTGIGIKRESMAFIFQEFKKVDSSVTRRYEGTGLGLALVKKYLEMQGGSIKVESEFGQGSDFTFRLPVDITKI